ncbi:hypothetical protein [Halogeometricum limi]|uniref:Uncharacterized protein n=1 Tax=Halogeometricum limi TaxID=555875 RepID=A0A1I6HJA7_9EURY|nr:hypothetical protein [Halogeometricum limi]SFR54390.1 hypothetical protein SAMN04488124_2297 [Halogeometricum limi]
MTDSHPRPVGVLVRALVAGCFVGGGVLALHSQRLVLAGFAFLVGYTMLATAAVVQGQRRRGVGLSLSGLGWMSVAAGVAVGTMPGTGLTLVVVGVALLVAGTGVVLWPMLRRRRGETGTAE